MLKKIIFVTLLLLPLKASAQVTPDSLTQEKMRLECESFLSHMPAGLQHKQSEAVQRAIKGDCSALNEIRKGRNQATILPPHVKTEFLTPTLCLYRPTGTSDTKRPIMLYLHGGGWTFGSINSCAKFCAAVAGTSECLVVALDYRLAPEHPFPAPLIDCIEAFEYLKAHAAEWGGDATRISIGGDSAGGNLAIATALSVSDVYSLIPIYPVTKVYKAQTLSWQQYAIGYGCDAELLESFNTAYAGHDSRNPLVSVALASDDDLRKIPPTRVISAGRDILYDQGREWIERALQLNCPVEHLLFPTATHLFITVPGQPTAFDMAVKYVSSFLNE